jgi:hypothetical protein
MWEKVWYYYVRISKYIAWYLFIFTVIAFGLVLFYELVLISRESIIENNVQLVVQNLKWLWLVSFPYVVFNLAGLLVGPPMSPYPVSDPYLTNDKTLRISFTSRGENNVSLKRSLEAAKIAINHRFRIKRQSVGMNEFFKDIEVEVITDHKLPADTFPKGLKVREIIVPEAYETERGSLYKARALQFSLDVNHHSKNTYVLRLDEESVITAKTLLGVIEFLQNKEADQVIAQGEILYNAYQYANAITITVADAIRTGDDLGRFRLQYMMGRSYFGMHGSFILVRSDIENRFGYDYGPETSITEDAHMALKIMDNGYKFGWLNGNVYEQSPYSWRDFIAQRKRWFVGLTFVERQKDITWYNRLILVFSRFMWAISWMAFVITVLNVFFPSETDMGIGMLGGFIFSVYVMIYLIGTYRNVNSKQIGRLAKVYLYLLTLLCIPLSTCLEACGVIAGMVAPKKQFQVVYKN